MKRIWIIFIACICFYVSPVRAQIYIGDMINILSSRMNDPDKKSITVARYLDALNLAQESLFALLPSQSLIDMIHVQQVTSFPAKTGDAFKGGIYKKYNAGDDSLFGQWVNSSGNAVRNIGQRASHIVAVKRNGFFCRLIKSIQSVDWNEIVLNNATSISPVAMEMSLGILIRPECTTGDTLSVYYVQKPRPMAYPLVIDTLQFAGRDTTRIKAFTTTIYDRGGGWAKNQNMRDYTNKHNYYIRKHVDMGNGGMWFTVNDTLIGTSNGWGIRKADICGLESDMPPQYHPLILDMAEALLWSQENKNPEASATKMSQVKEILQMIYSQYAGAQTVENK